jgi:Flp pilus assembly protein TadD
MMIYEGVQELHRTQETVRVGLDATVPDQIGRMFATLPRVGLAGQAETGPADLAVVSREQVASAPVAAARRLWCWDAGPADLPGLECRLAVPGYVALSRQLAVFEHRETAADTLAAADQALAAGNIALAAGFTQGILQRDPQNAAALVLSTRVAFQAGDTELGAESLKLLRAAAAGHPQIAALESELAQRQNPLTTLLERGWKQFADGETVEAARTAQQLMKLYPPHAEVCLLFARCMAKIWRLDDACTAYRQAIVMAPRETIYWRERAQVLALMGRHGEAFNDLLQAAGHAPDDLELQEEIARTAVILGHRPIAREATEAVLARRPGDAAALARLAAINDEAADAEGCDLIVCHLEISRLHGTGVLLHRFFAGATNLVTLRSRSLYQGKFELPGLHLVLDTQDKPLAEIEQQMRRLLAGLKIRRILCVPYYPCDFVHGVLARRITGAPLCAYVMDDQTVHGTGVPAGVARSLFSAADLRLAISPEMSRAYERTFGQPFGVLPPILASTAERVENHWRPAGGAAVHCALVGNIWSPRQFEQLRACVRGSRVRIDWFGNADVPWLPQDRKQLERDGIHCRGFIPESELARRLAGYPFVVVPSGELDGTENNEWLTRLSLPSRMVFIFAQTFTPMLVLGHPDTAAARFVARLDLGRCASYEPAAARAAMRELMTPAVRDGIMASARRAAPAFVMPRAGEWIWQSLAAGRPLPTALDALAMTVPAEPLLEKISA